MIATPIIFSFMDGLECFLCFNFLFPEKRRNALLCTSMLFLHAILNTIFSNFMVMDEMLREIILFIVLLLLLMSCFKDFGKNEIFLSVIYYTTIFITIILNLLINQFFKLNLSEEFALPILGHLIRIVAFILLTYFISKQIGQYGNKSLLSLLSVILPINLLVLVLFEGYFVFGENIYYIGILMISVLVWISIIVSIRKQYLIEANQEKYLFMEKILQASNEQNRIIEEKAKEIRKVKHDITNSMGIIHNLLMTDDYDNAKLYMNEFLEGMNDKGKYVISNYAYIDSLLNYKQANNKNINFDCSIALDNLSRETEFDVCSILSNLIDNSLYELNNNIDLNKTITIKLKDQGNFIFIEVTNDLNQRKNLLTEKNDKNNHGLGLEIVENIVKKYDGEMNIQQNSRFTVKIMLKKLPLRH